MHLHVTVAICLILSVVFATAAIAMAAIDILFKG